MTTTRLHPVLSLVCAALIALGLVSCAEPELLGKNISHLMYLEHAGALMPILVEGDTTSGVIVLILHGGPGGDALIYNDLSPTFSDPLEERYAVAYWDQRSSGHSRGTRQAPELTMDLIVRDTELVVDLLHARFGKDQKIFLFAHSYGGLLSAAYLLDTARQRKVAGWINVAGAYDYPFNDAETHRMLLEVSAAQIAAGSSVEAWEEVFDEVSKIDAAQIDSFASGALNHSAWYANDLTVQDGLANSASSDYGIAQSIYLAMFAERSTLAMATNSTQIFFSPFSDDITYLATVDRLSEITLPSIMMYGRYDFVVPPSLGEVGHERLGTPQEDKFLKIYERSNHSPMDTENELFMSDTIAFIEAYR